MSDKPKPTAADQPQSGKDVVHDDKKPCLCNGICLGKEQLHSNRFCQSDVQRAREFAGTDVEKQAERLDCEADCCTAPECSTRDHPQDCVYDLSRHDAMPDFAAATEQAKASIAAANRAITQERHQAEVYRQQMVEAEATVAMLKDELAEYRVKYHGSDKAWAWAVVDPRSHLRNTDGDKVDMLICWDHEDALSFQEFAMEHREDGDEDDPVEIVPLFPDATNWKQRAETAEAELARHPVSIAEANELQDILRTLTNSGTALKTSARELVSAWIRQAHEIDDLRGKLNDTNERLAKVREAYQIYQDTEDTDLYGEVQFLIAFVTRVAEALAEGEQK